MNKKYFLIPLLRNSFLVFVFYSGLLFPQNENVQFDQFTIDNGLSQSTITCIAQDYQGFMWFGSYDGLNKYDGYNFKIYRHHPNDSSSISDNFIWTIHEDKNHNLWIGTRDGLNLYNRSLDNFQHFKHSNHENSLDDSFVRAIEEDKDGNLWIGTNKSGIKYFDVTLKEFIQLNHNHALGSLINNNINVLHVDGHSNLLIGNSNGHLYMLSLDKGNLNQIHLQNDNSSIMSIAGDRNGDVWIGTQGQGLYKILYHENQQSEIIKITGSGKNTLNSNIILSLLFDKENKLWIGTEDAGLYCYLPETGGLKQYLPNFYDSKTLSHRSIWSLCEDKTGNIWIGTFAGGVNQLRKYNNSFKHYRHYPDNPQSLSGNAVSMFSEDSDGLIWIATIAGLNSFNTKTKLFKHYTTKNTNLKSDAVLSLHEDSNHRFWVGVWNGGLNLFDKGTGKFKAYTSQKNGLGSNHIFGILEDNDNGLWLCTYLGGLSYFDPVHEQAIVYNTKNSAISDNNVNAIIKDYTGNLWISAETGLNYFDIKTKAFTVYQYSEIDNKSLSKGNLLSIYQSGDSTLWVGTTGGLNRFDRRTKTFRRYYTEDGLPNNAIKGIVEDDNGNLWLSTNKGISRFNTFLNTFNNFDISDGLQGNEFYWHSIYKTRDGQILVGGPNGFNSFYPDQINNNPHIPSIVITDFMIFNKPVPINVPGSPLIQNISLTKEITLTYKESVISFEFSALNFISSQKNQYAYLMEGFDKAWNHIGNKRTAVYTNLDAGNYIFRVKGSNNDGVWNEKGVVLKITILPPFWKTWWAYAIYLLFITTIVYIVMRHLITREQLKNALKLEQLELEKMYEVDQMKSRFFTNVSHEFRTPITLIMVPLESIISNYEIRPKIKKKLQLIYRNAHRLLRMTNQLMDFHKIEAGELLLELSHGDIIRFIYETTSSFKDYAKAHQIQFLIDSDIEGYPTWFDPDKLDKIIYNILSNAFKFTPDGGSIGVKISIIKCDDQTTIQSANDEDLSQQYIQITIKDNGSGIPGDKLEHIFQRFYQADNNWNKNQGSGVGLALVYELINLYRGKITVDSTEGEGSTFTIRLPLDLSYLEKHQVVHRLINNDVVHPDLFEDNKNEMMTSLSQTYLGEELEKNENTVKVLPSILFIDDDPELRAFICDEFKLQYELYEAGNGLAGFQQAVELIPDIIISDIIMPEPDGIELCKRLKNDERTNHIPIILLTARTSDEHLINGLNVGAEAYIKKPFSINILKAQIINLLQIRTKLKEKYSAQFLVGDNKLNNENNDEIFLNKAVNIIKEHLHDFEFNAEVLSEEIGMSRMQLYRKFRALTDQTVHEFIKGIRLKAASQLLLKKRVTVTEVAYEVGFKDLNYFARCFRQQFGITPSQYMAQHKK